jgi:hypothetical protein
VGLNLPPPGEWPLLATHYGITITYDDGPTYTYEGQMPPLHSTDPIVHTFSDLPASGSLTVLFCCYAVTNWVAGKGQTESILARPTQDGTLVVRKRLTNYTVDEVGQQLGSV